MAGDRPRLAVILGANLNMLGRRNPEHYGTLSLAQVEDKLRERADQLGCDIEIVQSNSESELVSWVHANRDRFDGYVVNPGGFTMFGQPLRDAIIDTTAPYIEVHMSHIHRRGIKSIWTLDAVGQVIGFHWRSYTAALDVLDGIIRGAPT